MKTINGKANTLGSYEVFFGDYKKLFSAADDYAKVNLDDVKRVAVKYFGEKNRTVATLIPDKETTTADSETPKVNGKSQAAKLKKTSAKKSR